MHWLLIAFALAIIREVDSAPCPERCSCNFRFILCNGTGLNFIPKRISPYISELIADDNNITEMPLRMLINARSLERLSLARNKIESIRGNNFINTDSLVHLDLSSNRIRYIQMKAFFGLRKLRTLNLEGNNISRFAENAFANLESLRELILSNNKIQTLQKKGFSDQPNLEVLKLDGNKLSTLPKDVFKKLTMLRVLNLSKNRIQRISYDLFSPLWFLEELRLHHNQFLTIGDILPNQRTMDCKEGYENGEIKNSSGRGIFSKLEDLKILDLRSNLLKTIHYEHFQCLQSLELLLLRKNPWRCDCTLITTIEAFPGTTSIPIDDMVCSEPLEDKGRTISKLLTRKEPISTKERPYFTRTPVLPKDRISTIGSHIVTTKSLIIDITTSEINQRQGSKGSHKADENPMLVDDSTYSTEKIEKRPAIVKREHDETTHRDNGMTNSTKTRDIDDEERHQNSLALWWIVAAITVLIFIIVCCIIIGINEFMSGSKNTLRKRAKKYRCTKSSSFRVSKSNSRFYDCHQFSGRPLPSAPIARRLTWISDEVRWSNGGRYRIGSNRSSFVSIRTSSNASNGKPGFYSSGVDRIRHSCQIPSSTYSSVETNETKITDINQNRTKLPPLPCGEIDISNNITGSSSSKERMTDRDTKTKYTDTHEYVHCGKTKNDFVNGKPNHTSQPPPPPKRNESSKSRCRELMKKDRSLRNKTQSEYYEIGTISQEYKDHFLFNKYIKGILEQDQAKRDNKKRRDCSSNFLRARKNIYSDYGGCYSKTKTDSLKTHETRKSNIDKDEYDTLAFSTKKINDDTVQPSQFDQLSKARFESLGKMSVAQDIGFNSADEDFVFSYPIRTLQKSLRRGVLGSDQDLLDLLKDQDCQGNKSRHYTDPSELEGLSLALSGTTTDEENSYDVFVDDDEQEIHHEQSNFQSSDIKNAHSFLKFSNSNILIPKITVNECEEKGYEKIEIKPKFEVKNSINTSKQHEYHYLHAMYSGALPNNAITDIRPEVSNTRIHDSADDMFKINNVVPTNSSASDKEEVEELKNLVKSILQSDRNQWQQSQPTRKKSLPPAEARDLQNLIESLNPENWTHQNSQKTKSIYLPNFTSEIDFTESDETGYLSPISTLKKEDIKRRKQSPIAIEQKESCAKDKNRRRYSNGNHEKNKKIVGKHRKKRRSSAMRNSKVDIDDDGYLTSASEDKDSETYRPMCRRKHTNSSQRQDVRNWYGRTQSHAPKPDNKIDRVRVINNQQSDDSVFHSHESEIYSKASKEQNYEENCYEEIRSRNNSVESDRYRRNQSFSIPQTSNIPEENDYQEISKEPC